LDGNLGPSTSPGTSTASSVCRTNGGNVLDSQLVRICAAFSWQSVEKLALAEGEKFVLVLSGSQHNQGVYGIVEKLGERAGVESMKSKVSMW
jgi:hypothetical protein